MANLQTQMKDFHEKVRLRGFENNQDLREKREMLLKTLRENINKDDDEPKLFFKNFDQGSYAMHTGIKPLHRADDYDIDVGLIFDLDAEDHKEYMDDPVVLKNRIKKALDHPRRDVKIRRPCITVQYLKNGDNEYHVDLAIYRESENGSGHHDLARGKEYSGNAFREWEENAPKELIDKINNRFSGEMKEERAQMRRCIRYLKRWKDKQFSSGTPTSISLTCAAYHLFNPCLEVVPGKSQVPNDQAALKNLVASIRSQQVGSRIAVSLPAHPYSDLLGGMTDPQMETFI